MTAPGAKLGDILIAQGVIDEEKLIAALSDQRAFGGKLGRTLVDLGYVTEEQLVQALATQLGLTTIDLQDLQLQRLDARCSVLGRTRIAFARNEEADVHADINQHPGELLDIFHGHLPAPELAIHDHHTVR